MAVTTLNSVADYLLCFAQEHGDVMTPLKLQKMVFYADAWYMALNDGEELIADRFEAWVHGSPITNGSRSPVKYHARISLRVFLNIWTKFIMYSADSRLMSWSR